MTSHGDGLWHNGEYADVTVPDPQAASRGVFALFSEKGLEIADGTSNTIAISESVSASGNDTRLLKGGTVSCSGIYKNETGDPTDCMATYSGQEYTAAQTMAVGPNSIYDAMLPYGHRACNWAAACTMINGFTTIIPPNGPSCAMDTWTFYNVQYWGVYSATSHHMGA